MPLHTAAGHLLQRGPELLLIPLQTGIAGECFCSPGCTSTTAPSTSRASSALRGLMGPERTILYHVLLLERNRSGLPAGSPAGCPTTHTRCTENTSSAKVQALVHQGTCAPTGTQTPRSPPEGNLAQAPAQHSQTRNHAWGKQERMDMCIPLHCSCRWRNPTALSLHVRGLPPAEMCHARLPAGARIRPPRAVPLPMQAPQHMAMVPHPHSLS